MFMKQLSNYFLVAGLALVGGCKIADVQRSDETARFQGYLADQSRKLQGQTAGVLTMPQCEQLALANSLDLQIKQMSLKVQDDEVRKIGRAHV